jgi:hypothetical protein
MSLTARVGALACEGADQRERARVSLERALTIERKLMSGARYRPTADASPLEVITEVEELLRRILKGLATGELEGDLRATADEMLLAEGLKAADFAEPAMDETAEWRIPDPSPDSAELDLAGVAGAQASEIEVHRTEASDEAEAVAEVPEAEEEPETVTTRIVVTDVELPNIMGASRDHPSSSEEEPKADWFSAGEGEGEVEWPAFASPRRDRGEKPELDDEAADRVRYLFPVPDSTDWDVGELEVEPKRSR